MPERLHRTLDLMLAVAAGILGTSLFTCINWGHSLAGAIAVNVIAGVYIFGKTPSPVVSSSAILVMLIASIRAWLV